MADMTTVYLNGEFLPKDQARVSVMDRGFLFGDGVYEVIPVYAGRPFRLVQHLERLAHSLQAVEISLPWTHEYWETVISELVARNGGGNQSLYLQVTRGVGPVRDHGFPVDVAPTVFLMCSPLGSDPERPPTLQGIRAITADDNRWHRCDIKATSLLPNVLRKQQARDRWAEESILVRDGVVTEGAVSNVFCVLDGVIRTAPRGPWILGGITRDLLVELAAEEGLPLREEPVTREELQRATEIWISSSTRDVRPVVTLDGRTVGTGEAGPFCRRLAQAYYQFRQAFLRA